MWKLLREYWAPEGDGGGDGGGGGDDAAAAAAAAAAAGGDPDAGGIPKETTTPMVAVAKPSLIGAPEPLPDDPATGRPGWCPEKFFDAEAKAVNVEGLAKAHASLETMMGGHAGAPESYDATTWIPDGVPDGTKIDMESLEFKGLAEIFKAEGITAKCAEKLGQWYVNSQIGNALGHQQAAMAELGDGGKSLIGDIGDWVAANPDIGELVQRGVVDANSALMAKAFIERLSAGTRTPTPRDLDPATGEAATEADIAAKMTTQKDGSNPYYTDAGYRDRVDKEMADFHNKHGGHPGNMPEDAIPGTEGYR